MSRTSFYGITRRIEHLRVTALDDNSISYGSLGHGLTSFPGLRHAISTGDVTVGTYIEQETVQLSRITGIRLAGADRWLDYTTDHDLEQQRAEALRKDEQRDRERLTKNHGKFQQMEEALPPWLRQRITVFHERGGEHFALTGWNYELVIARLAELYDAALLTLSDEESAHDVMRNMPASVREYDEAEGCSGNQHEVAIALVRIHRRGNSIATTVSGLSPITGSPYYEKV